MQTKLNGSDANVDIIEYSLAAQQLENKLNVLKSLNTTVEGDDESKMTLNIQGTNKAMVVDLNKLKEAVTFLDNSVDEKNASHEDFMTKVADIDINLPEEEYLVKVVEAVGEVTKHAKNNKVLSKDSFVKIFRYTGDFAKIRSAAVKAAAQDKRMEKFGLDDKKAYLAALQETIAEEEKVYEESAQVIFDKLSISKEMFERSQQFLMSDPSLQMELFNMGIKMEQPAGKAPEGLTKEVVIDLVKKSNDEAFTLFKAHYLDVMKSDPMIMPVLISAIAHDWVRKNHEWKEEDFKAALFEHKIYEDPTVAQHMQQKQFELMMIAQQQNPMGGMGMGGPMGGAMPPSNGLGGLM